MASLEDIVAATKILAENPDDLMGGSGSKPEENRGRVSDVKKAGDGSAATKRVLETETVVESTFDSNSGLGNMGAQKIGIGNFSGASNGGTSVSVNGIDVNVAADCYLDGFVGRDKKIKDGEVSCTDNGGINVCKKLNGCGGNGSRADVDADGKGQGDSEKLEDRGHGFHVGDFVWGKIKSHPWWPGQVYDSRDASDFAVKHGLEGRLLVAFFGDGSCSWCLPSQLIPFVENFKEMSMDSSSKSFLNAIQRTVDEIGRVVESEMVCKCIPLEKREGLARPVVANAGVKAGVLVPEVDIRRLSVPVYGPAEVLAELMQFGKTVSVNSLFELAILRSWVSAFYRARGGYQLPVYHEPLHIEGLEDKDKDVTEVSNDFTVPIEVPIFGPLEDDWLSSPTVNTARSQASSDDKIYHRRKHKSVAELMGENSNVKPESHKKATFREEKEKSTSPSKEKTGRKRKLEVSESHKTTKEKILNTENSGVGVVDGVNKGTLSKKRKEIEVAVYENTCGEAKEESENISSPRERKKSRYLSPPYTYPIWRMGNSNSKMESESNKKVGEHMTMAPVDKASDEKQPIGELKVLETSVDTTPATVENVKKMTISVSDVNVPVSEVLLDMQFAAVDQLYLSKEGSLDTVWAFVSALRSSTYLHGENYKIFHKCNTRRKRKSVPSRLQNQENYLNQEKLKSANKKTSKAVKAGVKPDTSKPRKDAADKLEGNVSLCLTLTFSPGFPLPSKEEIVRLFSKFGSLNEKETTLVTDSHAVLIVYMKDSDAEAAFKSSLSENPFGVENVKYRLQLSSPGSKADRSRTTISSHRKRAQERPESSSQPTDDYMSDVRVIRRKLEIMTAILENYHSKFSLEEKSTLKDEMRHLMDNVETASEKVRVMAENVSY